MGVRLQPKRGNQATMPEIKNGQLLFVSDIGRIYMDDGTDRVEFYKDDIEGATCKSYTTVLKPTDWSGSVTSFTCSYSNDKLRAVHPPVITCTDSDKTNYNHIVSAIANPGVGIQFEANQKPTSNINLIIIDLG